MDLSNVAELSRNFFMMSLLLTSPVVIVSLIVGLVISIGQTVTSIQEQTLSFAPRIIAVVVLLIFMTNWYLVTLQNYTMNLFAQMLDFVQ
ncbi:MAG: flagellar biosynthetic protein FliQ [bacterium]|nr:flagellar biosynthetic protein FliQ [bacterium]